MVDTYWSDHCRHTTFLTEIDDVKIDDQMVQAAFDRYIDMRAWRSTARKAKGPFA